MYKKIDFQLNGKQSVLNMLILPLLLIRRMYGGQSHQQLCVTATCFQETQYTPLMHDRTWSGSRCNQGINLNGVPISLVTTVPRSSEMLNWGKKGSIRKLCEEM